jgi:hypothetical protein
MQTLLILVIAAAVAASLYALVKGIISMAQGSSNLNAARSQTLMQRRVAYQAIAVLLVLLLMALGHGS